MNTEMIIGQSSLIKRLRSILDSDMVVHAYLFTGLEGSGKKTFARFFGQALLCSSRDSNEKPCGLCKSCRVFVTDNHPDVVWIRIPEDKNEIIKKQIEDMQSDIKVKPYWGDRKIYFIDKAHTMNKSSQNAFLKTLEEPPPYGVIILLADSTGTLSPTILSRCQQIRVGSLTREETARILEDRLGIDREEALFYGGMAQGIPGRALKLASDTKLKELRDSIPDILTSPDDFAIVDILNIFMKNREIFNELLDILVLWYRDLLILKMTDNNNSVINVDKISLLNKQVKAFTIDSLKDMIEKIENCRMIANSSGNYSMTMENMLMGLQEGINKCRLL